MSELSELTAAVRSIKIDLDERHTENVDRLTEGDRKLDEVARQVRELSKAFPEGDWEGHRKYHEAVIEKIKARARFYEALRTELATKGLWALIVAICAALWFYLKAKFNS